MLLLLAKTTQEKAGMRELQRTRRRQLLISAQNFNFHNGIRFTFHSSDDAKFYDTFFDVGCPL